jgi:hypothetical protein
MDAGGMALLFRCRLCGDCYRAGFSTATKFLTGCSDRTQGFYENVSAFVEDKIHEAKSKSPL